MNQHVKDIILQSTKASDLREKDKIQDLWSGYGVLKRYALEGALIESVVVKHICLKEDKDHPRGWNTDISHQRKLKSYQVETAWYSKWSQHCVDPCHVPHCYACESLDNEMLIVLEDLNTTGYRGRRRSVTLAEIKTCLQWLAYFHATFMGQTPTGLWDIGTYWHLDTRPDELEVLDDLPLKKAAAAIDERLRASPFQSFVHGDAKLANFCFSKDGTAVAAVDFQYVGGGCGMKDVAYFIGSCVSEEECAVLEGELLESYFSDLRAAAKDKDINADALVQDWRDLYPVAWTDFHRFIKGWSPGHWKINDYSEQVAKKTLETLL